MEASDLLLIHSFMLNHLPLWEQFCINNNYSFCEAERIIDELLCSGDEVNE